MIIIKLLISKLLEIEGGFEHDHPSGKKRLASTKGCQRTIRTAILLAFIVENVIQTLIAAHPIYCLPNQSSLVAVKKGLCSRLSVLVITMCASEPGRRKRVLDYFCD